MIPNMVFDFTHFWREILNSYVRNFPITNWEQQTNRPSLARQSAQLLEIKMIDRAFDAE